MHAANLQQIIMINFSDNSIPILNDDGKKTKRSIDLQYNFLVFLKIILRAHQCATLAPFLIKKLL